MGLRGFRRLVGKTQSSPVKPGGDTESDKADQHPGVYPYAAAPMRFIGCITDLRQLPETTPECGRQSDHKNSAVIGAVVDE